MIKREGVRVALYDGERGGEGERCEYEGVLLAVKDCVRVHECGRERKWGNRARTWPQGGRHDLKKEREHVAIGTSGALL